jgi:glyoxylase-like metal-dependent hydrolase (beta-lactamase superfamily II)
LNGDASVPGEPIPGNHCGREVLKMSKGKILVMVRSNRSSGLKNALPLLLAAAATIAPAAAGPTDSPFTEESKLDSAQAGFHRLKIGKIGVTALSDGTAGFFVLNVLAQPKRAEAENLMAKSWVKQPIDASVNAFLIKLPSHTVLVDAGTGDLFGPKLAKLPGSLRASGVTPEDITDILITHIHPDHTGGLTIGGKMVFPNATVHVNKRELDFWTDKATGEKYPEPTKGFYQQVEPTIGPYAAAGHVKTFEGATELFPGLRTLPAYGHTPGHTYYVLEDGGEKLVFMGDTIHAPDAQFEDPDITIAFDVDQVQAAATRKKAFTDAAQSGYYVALGHMYFPGIGRLREEGARYRWLPIPYVNDATKR